MNQLPLQKNPRTTTELDRVVFPRREADHVLQQVLAATILLRTQAATTDGQARSRIAIAALDEVIEEIQDRLSDSLVDRQEAVLVVDDEPEMMLATQRAIEHDGFFVITAASGVSALSVLRETPVSAVVLDLVMPGLSGWDVLHEIRAVTGLPVLVVTAHALTEADRLRGFKAGADDFIAKPYSPAELAARIRAVLRRETRLGGTAARRATSFEGKRVAIYSRDAAADLEQLIVSRPLFHSLEITRARSVEELARDLGRAPWDLVIVEDPTPTEVGSLAQRLRAHDSIARSVLLIAAPELLSDCDGPVPSTLAFLSAPYRVKELWAAVEASLDAEPASRRSGQ